MTERPGHNAGQDISQRWQCADCGGDLEVVEIVANDAHATESFECVDCGATGNVQFGPGTDDPTIYGSVTDGE